MIHTISKYISLLLLLFCSVACTKDLAPQEQSLSVSSKELTLQSSGGESSAITIKSTGADWSYACGSTWIKISRANSQLICSAEDNNTGVSRYAKIILSSGQLVEEIIVHQLSSSSSISAEMSQLRVTQWGGNFTINVNTSHNNWETIASEDWVSAVPNTIKGTIMVSVKESYEREERMANLTIRDKQTGNTFDISITQDAIVYLLTPYLPFNASLQTIEEFELNRRSVILERPDTSTIGSREFLFKVRTVSPLFHRIEYRFKGDKMIEATMYAPFQTLGEEEVVINWLLNKGYNNEGGGRLFSSEQRAVVVRGVKGGEWYLRFSFKPEQPQRQATFATLPYGIVAEPNYQAFTEEQIRTWEANKGSTTISSEDTVDATQKVKTFTYTMQAGTEYPFVKTIYTLSTKPEDASAPVKIVKHIFPSTKESNDKVVWLYDGQPLLTDEFTALHKQNGFYYMGLTASGIHVLQNDNRSILMGVSYVPNGSNPYITIEYHYFKQ